MKVLETFNFIGEIINLQLNYQVEQFSNVEKLCNAIKTIKTEEEKRLPYHINIIDLLWANENAHSRILAHLLEQNDNGKFEILENFYRYLSSINENFQLKISNPTISSEKYRIDILVQQEKDFAIIIENKIHYATDQSEQLKRYIDNVKSLGYHTEQIYILYLTRDEWSEVADQSWGDYKEEFEDRYIKLTYRNHILPWLKNEVLPNVKIKDIYLKSALEQYIDHLEGLFSLRKIHKKMNAKLQEKISELLGLGKGLDNDILILEERLREIDEVKNQLNIIKEDIELLFWNNIEEQLKRDFPTDEIIKSISKTYPQVGICRGWNNTMVSILIEKEVSTRQLYYGIAMANEVKGREKKEESILKIAKEFSPNSKTSQCWYSYTFTTYENAYQELKNLIQKVDNYLKIQK